MSWLISASTPVLGVVMLGVILFGGFLFKRLLGQLNELAARQEAHETTCATLNLERIQLLGNVSTEIQLAAAQRSHIVEQLQSLSRVLDHHIEEDNRTHRAENDSRADMSNRLGVLEERVSNLTIKAGI